MKRAETLEDFMEFAHSAAGSKNLLTSQQERTSPDITIGDEDSGEASAITIHALLESSSASMYFSATYDDAIHYEEAIKQLQTLEDTIPSQKVDPSEIEKRTSPE